VRAAPAPPTPEEALRALAGGPRSAEAALAMVQLGAMLDARGGGAREAAAWYKRAADAGSADGHANYAQCLRDGRGVPRSAVEAARHFRYAADRGHAAAATALGLANLHGEGVTRDVAKAFRFFTAAAGAGDADGQLQLGAAYELGRGTPRDVVKAREHYAEAAAQPGDGAAEAREGALEALARLDAEEGARAAEAAAAAAVAAKAAKAVASTRRWGALLFWGSVIVAFMGAVIAATREGGALGARPSAAARARVPAPEPCLLCKAAKDGDVTRIMTLLVRGADIDAADAGGMSPLQWAAQAGHANAVRALLGAGADVNAADFYGAGLGATALMFAAANNNADALRALLAAPGVALDALDVNGFTALDHARMVPRHAMAKLLTAAGAGAGRGTPGVINVVGPLLEGAELAAELASREPQDAGGDGGGIFIRNGGPVA